MANCNDGSCACRVIGVEGISVTGSGTLSNPYVISSDVPALSESLQVNDTPTVNLTLRGLGIPTDPFVLQADATIKLTQLADVNDPQGGPAPGDVPVWIGAGSASHWEFQPPPAVPAGSVNVSYGIAGAGSVVDPLHINIVTPGAVGPTTGLEVYVDTAGNLRAVAPTSAAVDWSAITNKPSTFPPSPHTHVAADITNPLALSVGNSAKVGGHTIFVQSATPTGAVLDDLWFY